jgi:protein-S-isoprenylcysteine O-methyltransferase Ste14
LILRALLYAGAFSFLWGSLAVSLRPLDARLGLTVPSWLGLLGWLPLAAGTVLALGCLGAFVAAGRGTPAPFDPPREFVAVGPYRYFRNPMYVGGFAVLAGVGLVVGSVAIVGLAGAFLLIAHLFVVLYEEPSLARRFGEPYRRYLATVPRWWPALPGRYPPSDAGHDAR